MTGTISAEGKLPEFKPIHNWSVRHENQTHSFYALRLYFMISLVAARNQSINRLIV